MTAVDVTRRYGGEPFEFTYDHVDLADTVEFSSVNNWGIYTATNVTVGSAITPAVGSDGVTSVAGTFTASVTLYHLTTFTTAHVHWDGSGFSADYSLNGGTTWFSVPEDGVIALAGDPDFDVRISFAGGVVSDPAILNSLTVYILNTETMWSSGHSRQLTFSNDVISGGSLSIDTSVSIAAADNSGTLDPSGPPQSGSANLNVGTVEMWIQLASGTSVSPDLPAGTTYVNGVAGTPSAGTEIHVVKVLTTPANLAFSIGPNCTLSHLAVYSNQFTAQQVANLYAASSGSLPTVVVNDPAAITVTEYTTPAEIYAYTWSVVPSGKK